VQRSLPNVTRDATYAYVAELSLVIDCCELQPMVRDTSSGFTKVSIVVRLSGAGHAGEGEDITWDQIDQIELLRAAGDLSWLHGSRTIAEFSQLLGLANLFPVPPIRDSARFYRRWAFESAALDLALRQAGTTLAAALGREPRPVTFVVSTRLGDPPSPARVLDIVERYPGMRFKLDPTRDWTAALVEELAALGVVATVDLKGAYHGTIVDNPADPALYRLVAEGLAKVFR